jgi:hypothetical protein
MKKSSLPRRSVVSAGIALALSCTALGQSAGGYVDPGLTVGFPNEFSRNATPSSAAMTGSKIMFRASDERRDWTIALIASAAVALTGLATHDDNLTLIGIGCVLVSGVEVAEVGFRLNLFDRGFDLAQAGPVSFGIDPFAQLADSPRSALTQHGAYLKATFKF